MAENLQGHDEEALSAVVMAMPGIVLIALGIPSGNWRWCAGT